MDKELKFRRFQNRLVVLFMKLLPKMYQEDFILWYANKHAVNVRDIYDKIESYSRMPFLKDRNKDGL